MALRLPVFAAVRGAKRCRGFEMDRVLRGARPNVSSAPPAARLEAGLVERQLKIETETQEEAAHAYKILMESMVQMGKTSHMSVGQRMIIQWYVPLVEAIAQEQDEYEQGLKKMDRALYGPFLNKLKPDMLAVITLNSVINESVKGGEMGTPFSKLCSLIADSVLAEVNLKEMRNKFGKGILSRLTHAGTLSTRRINLRARTALEEGDWSSELKVKLGAALIELMLRSVKDKSGAAAFSHTVIQMSGLRKVGHIIASPMVRAELEKDALTESNPRNLPMLVEPMPWTRFDQGGFLKLQTRVMRTKGSRGQVDALRHAPLERVFEGLNALGKLPWQINGDVLAVAQECWDKGIAIAELPSQQNVEVPESPDPSVREKDPELWRTHRFKIRRALQTNAELHSLRCDTLIKLGIAQRFKDERAIFFPYNIDFRGRAYPIPPNLNHLGSDLCRGVLTFAEKRALGEKGLFWLKVQLANLWGFDKASFVDRVAWTEARMDLITDSALRPIEGDRWWAQAESPWQALAVCMELERAHASGDPAAWVTGQPVHMDGSCNGLQHYAALGRDSEGGRQVNLVDGNKPRDVYSGVCAIVVAKVAAEAARKLGPDATDAQVREHGHAVLVDGLIDRKVVKQTVMTSVYGVTFVGARRQIQNRLEEKLEGRSDMDPEAVEKAAYGAASFVATITMEALTELFSGARNTMAWLAECARIGKLAQGQLCPLNFARSPRICLPVNPLLTSSVLHNVLPPVACWLAAMSPPFPVRLVAKECGQPVSWVTPMGLPVNQPYRKGGVLSVKTVMQTVQVAHNSDDLQINVMRQKSAFPPNFVHSLDSTHMLLTAIRMKNEGIPFTAVHDSYWCHAGNVDAMNEALRSCFVDLYSMPILEDLKQSLEVRYPNAYFPPVPTRGELNLGDVKQSTYFFN